MINVIVTIDVHADRIDDFLRLVINHRNCTRREPGCTRFDVSRSGNRFVLYELFKDHAALTDHRMTTHYQRWRVRVGEFELSPRQHQEFDEVGEQVHAKIVDANTALSLLDCRSRIVFTNGVFDILGLHHVHHLQQCKAAGDVLIVGVNSDASAKLLKGESRPIQPENERCLMLANLTVVDFVIVFNEDTPANLVSQLCPAILAKDASYRGQRLPGQESAARVLFTNRLEGYSTTNLIDRIRLAS